MGYVQRAHCLYQDNEEELDHAVTLLAYDMLFGDDYVYDGQSPVPEVGEKPMIMGLEEIGISRFPMRAIMRGTGKETSMNIPRCMMARIN